MMRAMALAALIGSASIVSPARAQESPRRAVEIALCGGWGVTTQGAEGASTERSNDNGGLAFAGRLSFASSYFIRPFLEVGWTPLTASRETVGIDGVPKGIRSSLTMWSFTLGPSVDWWRLRAGAGLGLLRTQMTSTMDGVTITPRNLGMAYAFYLSGFVYQRPRLRAGVDVRYITSDEIGIAHVLFGLLLAGDILSW